MVNSHWHQQTHTLNVQESKYSILDVHTPLSKNNVCCSNGSEIPALTGVVTLEIDVCTTNAWHMTRCFNALHHCSRYSQPYFSHDVSSVEHVLRNKDEGSCTMTRNISFFGIVNCDLLVTRKI